MAGPSDPEKTAGFQSEIAESAPRANDHHHHVHARERLRRFLHPDGRTIHVADTPQHAKRLRKQLEDQSSDEPFDIHISGSPEHLDALKQTRSHHEQHQERLRTQHCELYKQFESVRGALDNLSGELDRVNAQGISLDAHFSRFGYDAHIKSYDDAEESSHYGSQTPPASLHERRRRSSASDKDSVEPLRLFNVPVVRQYFYKGVLWRATESQEVQSFELFIDLLYVGIIAINGDAAAEQADGLSLLRFVITFTLSWKIWNDIALLISWFKNEDVFQRVSILFLLVCLFGYTTNITRAFDGTYPTLIGFHLAARVYSTIYLALVAFLVAMVRPIMIMYTVTSVLGIVLWVGSIHVDWPYQLVVIWLAIAVDISGPSLWVFGRIFARLLGKQAMSRYEKLFEVFPALNIEHRVERTGAFVTLVFGYTVVAILYQSTVNGIDGFFGKGSLGLVQCFFFNWLYFEFDNANLSKHAIRRAKWSAFLWGMAHLPFIMAFVLSGGALARLVVAHDCQDTNVEHITEEYQARSESEIGSGIRWFYCGGMGISLILMGIIALSNIHKESKVDRLRKRHRLAIRLAVGIVIICLAKAERLNSLDLIGIVTALIGLVLITELWAASGASEKLFEWSKTTQYTGRCDKKSFNALADGKVDIHGETLFESGSREGGLGIAPL
ncbi:hypothetical protein K461DRAFT_281165 [Myriangium duriaei CBS 260.36]|uniref:Low temperature requirement protein LtrA n=1 Tax=Myriangium duriaei CBS 260.36 TaxID=1168546 RepID=A0A9P4IWN7_9PEZI|nr:hypothetical protein K461DRAFT_281165 [Myriangium duriaei CBS 260.36]